jgi:putative transposase
MPRSPRNFDPRLPYHITARGNGKQQVFFQRADYTLYLKLLHDRLNDSQVRLYHYCLMPNHVHLMFSHGTNDISLIMRDIQRNYVRHVQRETRLPGHTWQARFYHRAITDRRALIACGNYIEINPVRAGLAINPADWRYTSYHHYAGLKRCPLVTENPLYETLGATLQLRSRNYREQVRGAIRLKAIPQALAGK